MAPIEPDLANSNLRPVALFAGYITLTASLTALLSYDVLYKAFKALPPSQDTRHRKSNRDKHVQLFAILAVVSFAISCVHMTQYFALSFRVWAHEMGQELPSQLLGPNGIRNLPLGRWLSDTSFLQDAREITIEKSRRFWWTQQLFLGLAAWSVFVSLEGRRRHMRHLWAFLLLGQLVGISFSMNLFFLGILLTPIPLPLKNKKRRRTASTYKPSDSSVAKTTDHAEPQLRLQVTRVLKTLQTYLPPLPNKPHPATWTPHPLAFIPSLVVAHITSFFLPFATSTTLFTPLIIIMSVFPYRILYLDRLGPIAYGSTSKPNRNYTNVYRYISYASLALFLKQTFVALLDNDPGAHEHRHSHYLAKLHLPHEHERSALTRSGSAIAEVLGALNDHPVVSGLGYDVLLCALSLCCWAVVRGLNISKILSAAGLVGSRRATQSQPAESGTSGKTSSATPNKTGRPRKRKSILSEDVFETPADDKAAKNDSTFHLPSPDIELSIPRGEEEEEENPEAGAVSGVLFALGGLGVLAAGILGAEAV